MLWWIQQKENLELTPYSRQCLTGCTHNSKRHNQKAWNQVIKPPQKWFNKAKIEKKGKLKESPWSDAKRRIKRGKKFPGVQPFPYTDQKSTNVNHLLHWSVYLTHPTAKACSQKKCVVWKDQILRLMPKRSTGTTKAAMCRGTDVAETDFTLHSSTNNVPWLGEKSHLQLNKYMFIRHIATFPLN